MLLMLLLKQRLNVKKSTETSGNLVPVLNVFNATTLNSTLDISDTTFLLMMYLAILI